MSLYLSVGTNLIYDNDNSTDFLNDDLISCDYEKSLENNFQYYLRTSELFIN